MTEETPRKYIKPRPKMT